MSGDRNSAEHGADTGADLEEVHVVTVFLRYGSDVLLLRRSDAARSDSGRWGAVAGRADGDPEGATSAEIRAETGLDPDAETTLVRRGEPSEVLDRDSGERRVLHPFLFDCGSREIEPDEEASEHEWAPPTAILRRETVPGLWASYDRVRPTPETVADDSDHGSAYISLRALEVLRDEAALAVERGGDGDSASTWTDLEATARALRDARPAMAVVANRINRAVRTAGQAAAASALEATAHEGIDRAIDADADAAALAADRLPDSVATLSRSGTVARAIERADPSEVLVAESRPGREGVGTAERFAEHTDATVTLTTDAALADRLAATGVEALVVGADTVLPDGRVVNKVGTRAAALAAANDGIDCYVVAASDKVAPAGGDHDVDREKRDPTGLYDGEGELRVANPTFDVTPAESVDAVVTERGVLDTDDIPAIAEEHRALAEWDR